ncbi:UNVERIFIED_CONTAM: hypothetical protein K2H54_026573 [Gekko kuhli]
MCRWFIIKAHVVPSVDENCTVHGDGFSLPTTAWSSWPEMWGGGQRTAVVKGPVQGILSHQAMCARCLLLSCWQPSGSGNIGMGQTWVTMTQIQG